MKRLFYFLFIAAFFPVFQSCDYVAAPFENNNPGPTGPTGITGQQEPFRKILIEDFTGHKCGNCPGAAITGQQLKNLYGDTVVLVGVHAGFFAAPDPGNPGDPYATDFRTTAGEAYNTTFGNDIAGNPNGLISRSDTVNNNIIVKPANWGTAVSLLKETEPAATIDIAIDFDGNSTINTLTVKTKFLENLSGDYNLIIYITEDNITDWQLDYSANPVDVQNYNHRHVLRDNINGTWGSQIATGFIAAGDSSVNTYTSYVLDPAWVTGNCTIVAYISESCQNPPDDCEIIQVEEKHLVE